MDDDCISINCIEIVCIDVVVDDDPNPVGCDDGQILTGTVGDSCVDNPVVVVNNGGACVPGGAQNTLELIGCCGRVEWRGIFALGHSGVAVINDPNANPTTFTMTEQGPYEIRWGCCPV